MDGEQTNIACVRVMNHSLILVICELGLATSDSEQIRPTHYHPVENLATRACIYDL